MSASEVRVDGLPTIRIGSRLELAARESRLSKLFAEAVAEAYARGMRFVYGAYLFPGGDADPPCGCAVGAWALYRGRTRLSRLDYAKILNPVADDGIGDREILDPVVLEMISHGYEGWPMNRAYKTLRLRKAQFNAMTLHYHRFAYNLGMTIADDVAERARIEGDTP